MKLIVGLGNPGLKYQKNRHNIGLRIASSLSADIANPIYKPQVFYNLVGPEITKQLNYYKLEVGNLLVIHDDFDLLFPSMKLQFGRSAAGNHGVESIISALGTRDFWRLRIGTGPRGNVPGEDFVLQNFNLPDEEIIKEVIIPQAQEIILDWLEQ